MIEISVVIPTYNRAATLTRCLAALLEQTLDRSRYEILVVDDASADDTQIRLKQFDGLRTFRQPRNTGPAAARNVAIRAAQGRYVLFLDDDVVAPPPVLAQHVAAHGTVSSEDVAILGNAVWPSDEPMSPLMRYMLSGRVGREAPYEEMPNPNDVSYEWFVTRHVSAHRSFLLRHGLFDEEFRYAYGEDTELGYRLQQQGLRIVYRRDIVVQHHHPTSYRQSRQQRLRAGEVNLLMARKHPELADLSFLELSAKSRVANWVKRRGTETLLDPILDWADRRQLDHPWLARAYRWALDRHKVWALRDAVRRAGGVNGRQL